MRREIVTRLVKAMTASGLDAVVVVSPENFAYVSGFVVPSQSLMRWRHAVYVVTASGRCAYSGRRHGRDDDSREGRWSRRSSVG